MIPVPVVLSGDIPTYTSKGAPRVACEHMAEWLKVYDALQVARGRGHITLYQTLGGADASAGTHECGSAWDMSYTGTDPIMDAREMGAAVWPRIRSLGWTTGEHVHGVISCGDNNCNAYQYAAYWNGYNGLGLNGIAAGDPLPKPSTRRTWREGIAWAQAEITRIEDDVTVEELRAELRAFFRKDPPTDDQVAAMYAVVVGRDPESELVVQQWIERAAAAGWDYWDTRRAIGATPEAKAWAITSGYLRDLGRKASEAERIAWMGQASYDLIIDGIHASPEAQARRAKGL